MSSQRRIDSSRANGAKSHGATTPEGKARIISSNIEHGILARAILLTEESSGQFSKLFAALEEEHRPMTETEHGYVQNMTVCRWRIVRIWNLERATLQQEFDKSNPVGKDPANICANAFQFLADESRVLDLLQRYETRYQRQHDKSLQMLQKMQKLRQEQDLPRLPIPETDTPEPPESTPPEPAQATHNQSPTPQPPPPADPAACHPAPIPTPQTDPGAQAPRPTPPPPPSPQSLEDSESNHPTHR